jgi:hypothetical protein
VNVEAKRVTYLDEVQFEVQVSFSSGPGYFTFNHAYGDLSICTRVKILEKVASMEASKVCYEGLLCRHNSVGSLVFAPVFL